MTVMMLYYPRRFIMFLHGAVMNASTGSGVMFVVVLLEVALLGARLVMLIAVVRILVARLLVLTVTLIILARLAASG